MSNYSSPFKGVRVKEKEEEERPCTPHSTCTDSSDTNSMAAYRSSPARLTDEVQMEVGDESVWKEAASPSNTAPTTMPTLMLIKSKDVGSYVENIDVARPPRLNPPRHGVIHYAAPSKRGNEEHENELPPKRMMPLEGLVIPRSFEERMESFSGFSPTDGDGRPASTPSVDLTRLSQHLRFMGMTKDQEGSPTSNASGKEQERPDTAGTKTSDQGYGTSDLMDLGEDDQPSPAPPDSPIQENNDGLDNVDTGAPRGSASEPNGSPSFMEDVQVSLPPCKSNVVLGYSSNKKPSVPAPATTNKTLPNVMMKKKHKVVHGEERRVGMAPWEQILNSHGRKADSSSDNDDDDQLRAAIAASRKQLIQQKRQKEVSSNDEDDELQAAIDASKQQLTVFGNEKMEYMLDQQKTAKQNREGGEARTHRPAAPSTFPNGYAASSDDDSDFVPYTGYKRKDKRSLSKMQKKDSPRKAPAVSKPVKEDSDDTFSDEIDEVVQEPEPSISRLRARRTATQLQRPRRQAAANKFKDHDSDEEKVGKEELFPYNAPAERVGGGLKDKVFLVNDDAPTTSKARTSKAIAPKVVKKEEDKTANAKRGGRQQKKEKAKATDPSQPSTSDAPAVLFSEPESEAEDINPYEKLDVGKVEGDECHYFVHRFMDYRMQFNENNELRKKFIILWWQWNLTSCTMQWEEEIDNAKNMFAQFAEKEKGFSAIRQNLRENYRKYGLESPEEFYRVFEKKSFGPPNIIASVSDKELKTKLKNPKFLELIGYWRIKRVEVEWLKIRDPEGNSDISPLYIENWVMDNDSIPEFKYIMDLKLTKGAQNEYKRLINERQNCPKYIKCGCSNNRCNHKGKCIVRGGGTRLFLTEDYCLEEVPTYFKQMWFFVHGCSENCPCDPSKCKRNVLKGAKRPTMVVFYEPHIKGFGVRTLTEIKKGRFITNYAGEAIIDRDTQKPAFKTSQYSYEMENRFWIDASRYGNEARFFSHACSPNLFSVRLFSPGEMDRLIFFANRDIEAGEELTIDYHPNYPTYSPRDWEILEGGTKVVPDPLEYTPPRITCQCGYIYCRGWL